MKVILFVGPYRHEYDTMKQAEDGYFVFTLLTGGKYGPGWFVEVNA